MQKSISKIETIALRIEVKNLLLESCKKNLQIKQNQKDTVKKVLGNFLKSILNGLINRFLKNFEYFYYELELLSPRNIINITDETLIKLPYMIKNNNLNEEDAIKSVC